MALGVVPFLAGLDKFFNLLADWLRYLSPAAEAILPVSGQTFMHFAISMGGRVALEAALTAPDVFRAVIAIAPYLPWRRFRFLLEGSRLISPELAGWLPLEAVWPALRWLARGLETLPYLRDDELAQAGARLVYFLSCPATRAGFLSAARETALDPAWGEHGLWTRLPRLALPAAFVWGERDQLVSLRFSRPVARTCPQAAQVLLPCVGHWVNGPHHVCLAEAIAGLVIRLLDGTLAEQTVRHASGIDVLVRTCTVESGSAEASCVQCTSRAGRVS